jgi:ribokinase
MFDLISIGGATRDIFFHIESLQTRKEPGRLGERYLEIPYGEKIVSSETFYSYGGGAINIAVCGARLGLKTASVCNIGREGTGSLIIDYLKKEGVNTSLVGRDAHLHTGLSALVVGEDGEHTGFLERGANNHLYLKSTRPLKKARWFYISSLTGESEKILPEIFAIAERERIKIAFNPGSKQLGTGYHGLKNYLAQADILILNLEEAEELVFSKTKKMPKTEGEILRVLDEVGGKISVVTDAEKGSHAISDGKTFHERCFSTTVVDTTGAGDCFGGTFVFGQIQGLGIQESLRLAAINSASVVAKMGASAGLLRYNDLKGK